MKLGAVALALLVNSLVVGGAAYFSNAYYDGGQSSSESVACASKRVVHLTV
jgi:hypothetical protein